MRFLLTTVSVLLVACSKPPEKLSAPAHDSDTAAPATTEATSRVRVETARVELSSARLDLALPGEVQGGKDSMLAAALGGYVEAVLVKEGARVKRGQSLARIDTSVHVARRDQVTAEYAQAKADNERAQALGDAVSRTQRDAAATRLKVAEAALRTADVQVSRSLIIAPFDGVVASLNVEVGEVAPPGAPVARLVQLDPLEVSVSVSDRDVVALRPGMPVSVTTEASGEVLQGDITFVGPAADLKTRAFTAKVAVRNPNGRLLPGMIATVRLTEELEGGVPVLPQYVLVTRTDGVGVFVDENGAAHWRPLTLGRVLGDRVVVESGLKEGERIVVTGHRELVDGDLLLATREGVCCSEGRVAFSGASL